MGKRLSIFQAEDPANHSWVGGHINPFNKNVLEGQTITTTVTSIPSPYARMHLFEVGFRQLAKLDDTGGVSEEIRKCVAHCLDVYELLFRCRTGEQLRSNNIVIDMHRYQDTTDVASNTAEYKYLDALCTFRKSYIRRYRLPELDAAGNVVLDADQHPKTKPDTTLFKVFFTISKDHELIAATSPFTGFYVKENPKEVSVDGKLYFAKDELDIAGNNQWLGLEKREQDFQEFLYKLVHFLVTDENLAKTTSFKDRYADFWLYIDKKIDGVHKKVWSKESFVDTYPDFDFSAFDTGNYGFPIHTKNPVWTNLPNKQKVYVIPNEYDSCTLKYMIAPDESANFKLDEADYEPDILKRKNPINQLPLAWVSVDDFLDDTINIIQGEINNEAYFCVKNEDQSPDAGPEYQVLPPLKRRFFEFFKIEDLISGGENGTPLVKFALQHRQNQEGETFCLFTIKVPYLKSDKDEKCQYLSLTKVYDNAHCRTGIGLELGIYPFLKTPADVDDFYRVACYVSNSMDCTDMELLRLNNNGYISDSKALDVDNCYVKKSSGNSDIATALGSNIFYYALDGTYLSDENGTGLAEHKDVSFDILNLKYGIKLPGQVIEKEQLVIPLMKQVSLNKSEVRIAIDLGTSNTYICYSQGAADPKPFETANSNIGNAHFVKLGKVVGDMPNTPEKDKYDMRGLYRLTQRCELIPAYFAEGQSGYHFPVPTALNIKGTPADELKKHDKKPLSTLFDVNIPFSYFEDGTRSYNGNPIDDVRSNFKWFKTNEDEKKGEAMLYAEQLCLMLRSDLLARHRKLDNVKLIFTYPLAFDGNILSYYQRMWKRVYAKYFNKTADSEFMAAAKVNIEKIDNVLMDTESRTPLFSDKALLTKGARIISADIGGGSTDVMVYDSTVTPSKEMCFSYKFAGNSLFCGEVLLNSQNVWYKEILKKILPRAIDGKNSGLTQKKAVADDNGRDAIQLMNKCFSDESLNGQIVNELIESLGCQLLLTLHNSAIIYAMADLCRSFKADGGWIPTNLFFSGNGSRMLFLNMALDAKENSDVILEKVSRDIFGELFPEKRAMFGGVNVKKSSEPKAATAKGVLIGLSEGKDIGSGNVEHWVNYGQKDAVLYKVPEGSDMENEGGEPIPLKKVTLMEDFKGKKDIYNSVIANVEEFLNIYFTKVMPRFKDLANAFVYDKTSTSEKIGGKRNIHYYLTVSNNSFINGYQAGLGACEEDDFKESLFFAVMSQIILDLCKSL